MASTQRRNPFLKDDQKLFEFSLADKWGMPRALMLRWMATTELAEWMGFFNVRELRSKQDRAKREAMGKVGHGRR
jgi:hypothetical protein